MKSQLHRQIKGQNAEFRVIMGVWTIQETTSDIYERVGLSDPDMLVTSLADCAYQVPHAV